MAKYIIIGAILLAAAAAEIVSYVWTARLLRKRKEGLDRRQTEIEKREALLETPVQFETTGMRPVRVAYRTCITRDDIQYVVRGELDSEAYNRVLEQKRQMAVYGCLNAARDYVTLKVEKEEGFGAGEGRVMIAELWVCKKETDEAG